MVLDVGCAAGYLAEQFQKSGCYIVGVEVDEKAAEFARKHCDEVLIGDIECMKELPYPEAFFDVIVYGDILEHLREPISVLLRDRRYLSKDGYIVASIPNVAYWLVRLELLIGRFGYEDWGILDRTHLRFYTFKTAKNLFLKSGYEIVKTDYTGRLMMFYPFKLFPTLFAYQFIIIAKPLSY